METVSQILVRHMKRFGVSHVFGIPGKPITPLVLEMDNQGITFVLSKHECGAGFEAAGYAFSRQTLGVALGTAGPGGINMLTAAGQAKATNLPVLFITGQPPILDLGQVLGQDSTMFGTDLVKMFEPVTKFSARIDRGELLRNYLEHALEQAFTGVKGPVHLCIPLDVLGETIPSFDIDLPEQRSNTIASNLDHVVSLLEQARTPLLLVGGGVHAPHIYDEIEAFVTRWQIPVTTTPGGKSAIASRHPLSLGSFGLGGVPESEAYLKQGVDLLIVMGSQLSDLEIPGLGPNTYPEHLIHFDFEPKFIGKTIKVPTTSVLGDLKSNLQALLKYHAGKKPERALPVAIEEPLVESTAPHSLSGQQAIRVLQEHLPEDALIFGDAGSHSFYAIKYLDIRVPGTFYFEEVFATMGRAIGYSVGAKFGAPHKTVVALTGDGCMFMSGTEVSTSVNYDAPVIFIVFNNLAIDMVDKGMAKNLGKAVGTVYSEPLQAAKFGESMGARGYRCTTEASLKEAIQSALQHNQTSVIEIMMDPHEIPPTMKRG